MSKDLDVVFRLHSRQYDGKPPLTDAVDFVIVNCQLHDEFDAFKKAHTSSFHSYILLVELLKFYYDTKCPSLLSSQLFEEFGKSYLYLSGYQIDSLVEWVYDMRERCNAEGTRIFHQIHSVKSLGTCRCSFYSHSLQQLCYY